MYIKVMFLFLLIIGLSGINVNAQPRTKKLSLKRGVGTISVRGHVGGEALDNYKIKLMRGKRVNITAAFDNKSGNVSFCLMNVGDGDPKCETFEDVTDKYKKSVSLKEWKGKISKTGWYEIDVTAHPDPAKYTIIITVR